MNNAEKAVVDIATGEVVQTALEGDTVRIIRRGTKAYLESQQKWDTESFFKGYVVELRKVLPSLAHSEKALLISIAPYVSYYDCHLQYSNGRDIGIRAIVDITGYSKKTVVKILASLVDKDILYRGKNSKNHQWFVNPWLVSRGSVVNPVLKAMFKNYYIRTKDCKWKDLGDM